MEKGGGRGEIYSISYATISTVATSLLFIVYISFVGWFSILGFGAARVGTFKREREIERERNKEKNRTSLAHFFRKDKIRVPFLRCLMLAHMPLISARSSPLLPLRQKQGKVMTMVK